MKDMEKALPHFFKLIDSQEHTVSAESAEWKCLVCLAFLT